MVLLNYSFLILRRVLPIHRGDICIWIIGLHVVLISALIDVSHCGLVFGTHLDNLSMIDRVES